MKKPLKGEINEVIKNVKLNEMTFTNRNVGKIIVSYSFVVASATNDNAGCRTAAKTSAVRISCCRQGHTCCHHIFYYEKRQRKRKKQNKKKLKFTDCFIFTSTHFSFIDICLYVYLNVRVYVYQCVCYIYILYFTLGINGNTSRNVLR